MSTQSALPAAAARARVSCRGRASTSELGRRLDTLHGRLDVVVGQVRSDRAMVAALNPITREVDQVARELGISSIPVLLGSVVAPAATRTDRDEVTVEVATVTYRVSVQDARVTIDALREAPTDPTVEYILGVLGGRPVAVDRHDAEVLIDQLRAAVDATCDPCEGLGVHPRGSDRDCSECGGRGWV